MIFILLYIICFIISKRYLNEHRADILLSIKISENLDSDKLELLDKAITIIPYIPIVNVVVALIVLFI